MVNPSVQMLSRSHSRSPPKNLEELADSVEVFRLVNEAEEDVVDLLPDEGSETQEFAVDSMETGLEEIPLSRVLAVEQLQQLTEKKKRENVE